MHRKPRSLIVAVVLATVVAIPSGADAAPQQELVQLLAIGDFHGSISRGAGPESTVTDPGPDGVYGVNASGVNDDTTARPRGAVSVAGTVQARQVEFRGEAGGSATSLFVGVGDLIGESPPMSEAFMDEPTIELFNEMGMDVSSVGNHEFDRGTHELRRLSAATDGQYTDDVAACQDVTAGVDGCFGRDAHAFTGADFPYLAANVLDKDTGEPMLPPYAVFYTPSGGRVALIGVAPWYTARGAPPEGVADVEFVDEADAVNRWTSELRRNGIEAIGVLLHEGGVRPNPPAPDPNSCDQLAGAALDINARIDPAVDFIVSAHTHHPYICQLPGPDGQTRLVTQAAPFGQMVTDIRLTLNRQTGDIDRAATYSATNVPVIRSMRFPELQATVDYWSAGPDNQPVDAARPQRGGSVVSGVPDQGFRREAGLAILSAMVILGFGAWYWSRDRRRRARGLFD